MGAISELIGMEHDALVSRAVELLADGNVLAARIAAMLANDGRPCPFVDPRLVEGWQSRPPLSSAQARRGARSARPTRTSAAMSAFALDDDE